MKEKIGIALLILVNSGFIYLMVLLVILSYGLINGHHGLKAAETADRVAKSIFTKASVLSFILLAINYTIFKILIHSKKPIVGSLILTVIGIAVSIPSFLKEKRSFIEYQYSQVCLKDYIDCDAISDIQLSIRTDTIPIAYCREFVQIIGNASYKKGMWKYQRSMKIVIRKTNGTKNTILSNGELFELNGKFFKSKENLVEKYLRISKVELSVADKN